MPIVKLSELKPVELEPRTYSERAMRAAQIEASLYGFAAGTLALGFVFGSIAFYDTLTTNTGNGTDILRQVTSFSGQCRNTGNITMRGVTGNGRRLPDQTIETSVCIQPPHIADMSVSVTGH